MNSDKKSGYSKISVSTSSASDQSSPEEETIYIGASTVASSASEAETKQVDFDHQYNATNGKADISVEPKQDELQENHSQSDYDDLAKQLEVHDVPFQGIQKIILVAMALLVIGFCIYWFGLR